MGLGVSKDQAQEAAMFAQLVMRAALSPSRANASTRAALFRMNESPVVFTAYMTLLGTCSSELIGETATEGGGGSNLRAMPAVSLGPRRPVKAWMVFWRDEEHDVLNPGVAWEDDSFQKDGLSIVSVLWSFVINWSSRWKQVPPQTFPGCAGPMFVVDTSLDGGSGPGSFAPSVPSESPFVWARMGVPPPVFGFDDSGITTAAHSAYVVPSERNKDGTGLVFKGRLATQAQVSFAQRKLGGGARFEPGPECGPGFGSPSPMHMLEVNKIWCSAQACMHAEVPMIPTAASADRNNAWVSLITQCLPIMLCYKTKSSHKTVQFLQEVRLEVPLVPVLNWLCKASLLLSASSLRTSCPLLVDVPDDPGVPEPPEVPEELVTSSTAAAAMPQLKKTVTMGPEPGGTCSVTLEIAPASPSLGQDGTRRVEEFCACCWSYPATLVCSVCKAVRYCDKSCQKRHWSTHKDSDEHRLKKQSQTPAQQNVQTLELKCGVKKVERKKK